jgi:hypothetical protein
MEISYPGYDPMVDARFRGAKRIGWAFPAQNTVGVGPGKAILE